MKDVVRTTGKYNNNQRNSHSGVPRKKHKRNLSLYYAMVFIIATAILIVLSLTVFFNINVIVIKGESIYSTQRISDVLGVKKGQNLFRINIDDIESHVLNELPEIETVKVRRNLPDKLSVTITPCVSLAQIQVGDKIFEISQSNKIIREINDKNQELLSIKGLEPQSTQIGVIATSVDTHKNDILKDIIDTIEKIDFTGITTIDITDRLNIKLIYNNNITLEVGSSLDLEYKIEFLKSVTDEKIDEDFDGKIVMFGNKFAQILESDSEKNEELQNNIIIKSKEKEN